MGSQPNGLQNSIADVSTLISTVNELKNEVHEMRKS